MGRLGGEAQGPGGRGGTEDGGWRSGQGWKGRKEKLLSGREWGWSYTMFGLYTIRRSFMFCINLGAQRKKVSLTKCSFHLSGFRESSIREGISGSSTHSSNANNSCLHGSDFQYNQSKRITVIVDALRS
eukprot:755135-Hanusia_phi.AAC.10